jgi:Xaa-Pro dipeptidase
MNKKEEFAVKISRLRRFLSEKKKEGILINRQDNFAWLTCGGENRVVTASDSGASELLVTAQKVYLVANNIESGRVMQEEISGLDVEPLVFPWDEEEKKEKFLSRIAKPGQFLSDNGSIGKTADLAPLHIPLTGPELSRYRNLGKKVGESFTVVAKEIRVGDTEHKIAAIMAEVLLAQGICPAVLLIAADKRIARFRHPIPTKNRLKKYVMLVVCGRQGGLIVSATRLVSFGKLSPELEQKHKAVAYVDAAFITETKPGKSMAEIFTAGVKAYRDSGFPEEWRQHHQGGPTGYAGRYFKATPTEKRRVTADSGFAWNPSITGTKSEDTILVTGKKKPEIISTTPGWPAIKVVYKGTKITRPAILIK